MTYASIPHGFETVRFDGVTGGISTGPWSDFIVPGGKTDGITVFTRPGIVHSVIIERVHDLGFPFPNILVLDFPDTPIVPGPPNSGSTSVGLTPAGLATNPSFTVELHMQCFQGILIRFDNQGAQSRIAVVYKPMGRNDFVKRY